MRTVVLVLMLVSFMFAQSACSISAALKQPPPADLQGIGVGKWGAWGVAMGSGVIA